MSNFFATMDFLVSWLKGPVAELLGRGTLWGKAAAVGMTVRLTPRSKPYPAPGTPDSLFLEGRAWAKALSVEQREELHAELAEHISTLVDRLDGLGESSEEGKEEGFGSQEWLEELFQIFHSREQAEGVRWILRQATGNPAFDVSDLDDDAELFVRSIPFRLELRDELLYQAGLVYPDAWWAWGVSR